MSNNMSIDDQLVAVFVVGVIILVVVFNVFVFWFALSYKRKEFEFKINSEKLNANLEIQMLKLRNETRNTEMKYFARELHDNLGQITSQLKMFLDFNVGKETITDFNTGAELVDKLKIEIRRLSSRYNHFVFDEINLIDSISNDILRISKFSNMMIDLHMPNEEVILENHIKAEVFRIYQEIINNTMNHSKAKNVKILINSNELMALEMVVEDDGIGFDPSQMTKGSGLYNVRERANQIGGCMNFISNPGTGTLTTLTISNSVNAE